MSLETLKPKVEQLIEKAQSGGNTDELEAIIDNSGVLDSTEETVTEKVEQLVDKASDENKWYEVTQNLNQTISNFFVGCTFETPPRMDFSKVPKTLYWFNGCKNLKAVDFYMNTESCTVFSSMFSGCSAIEYIDGINTSKGTTLGGLFRNCTSLHTIGKLVNGVLTNPLDFSSYTSGTSIFMNCVSLVNVSFVEESIHLSIPIPSPVLSDESIQSIIDGLATVETAQTLTLDATVKAKLTQTQLDTITGKNWSLA